MARAINDGLFMNDEPLESARLNGNYVYKLSKVPLNYYWQPDYTTNKTKLFTIRNEVYKYLNNNQINSKYNLKNILDNNYDFNSNNKVFESLSLDNDSINSNNVNVTVKGRETGTIELLDINKTTNNLTCTPKLTSGKWYSYNGIRVKLTYNTNNFVGNFSNNTKTNDLINFKLDYDFSDVIGKPYQSFKSIFIDSEYLFTVNNKIPNFRFDNDFSGQDSYNTFLYINRDFRNGKDINDYLLRPSDKSEDYKNNLVNKNSKIYFNNSYPTNDNYQPISSAEIYFYKTKNYNITTSQTATNYFDTVDYDFNFYYCPRIYLLFE